jgi:DEAD/DEAH box helicase domain-containing protein
VPDWPIVSDRTPLDPELVVKRLLAAGAPDRLTHLRLEPARAAQTEDWPDWVHPHVVDALHEMGVALPWRHQVAAAELAHRGRHVALATGTASGKSLGYLLPALSAILDAELAPGRRGPTVLYVSPTKALAHDQLSALGALRIAGLRAATYDGDSSREERDWAREHASYVLTNPDMLHRTLLPGHFRWAGFLSRCRYVVIDECHHYRGVFGAHVAAILRRLRRLCAHYGAAPTFVLASATIAEPQSSGQRLTGLPTEPVTDDGSPRGATALALWEPPFTGMTGEHGAAVRRTATAEAAALLADLVAEGLRTLAFVRSRRGAEVVALAAGDRLREVDPALAGRVAAYRGGYLPEERRELERSLRAGELLGVATTNALELGIDIAGLDVVVMAGFPGTRVSLWQQAGRAGRSGQGALAVLVARDDPLDTYLVNHPQALFGPPVEATVFDPNNPYVLTPHLCAAAQELPLAEDDLELFGPAAAAAVQGLAGRGLLRRRPAGWFWTSRQRAADLADIRTAGGVPVRVVEDSTGRLLGTVDVASAPASVHAGAVYLHRGETYLVRSLDLADAVALVTPAEPDYSTAAREVTDIRLLETDQRMPWGEATICLGSVEVTSQVVSFLRRRVLTGAVLSEEPLDLPERTLRTRAVWWTVSDGQLASAGMPTADLAGSAHAAEHAAIGLLPLFATCDRWDIGGVSTARHADTGLLTVFVYDGQPGGAGFAERGFAAAGPWLSATRAAIRGCDCPDGCPSCVQSPKCGNGNAPLDKAGAVGLLDVLLAGQPGSPDRIGKGRP